MRDMGRGGMSNRNGVENAVRMRGPVLFGFVSLILRQGAMLVKQGPSLGGMMEWFDYAIFDRTEAGGGDRVERAV